MKTRDVRPEVRPFFQYFDKLAYRHNYAQVFDDVLTVILTQFALPGTMTELHAAAVGRYNQEERKLFTPMLHEYIKAMGAQFHSNDESVVKKGEAPLTPHWFDFWGALYEELSSRSKASAMGQFFTPEEICNLMVRMTGDIHDGNKTGAGEWINEPCAGSGRMILAYNSHAPGNYFAAQDLDPVCCKMTAVNMLLHGCVGEISCDNSLWPHGQEYRFSWSINPFLNRKQFGGPYMHLHEGKFYPLGMMAHILPMEMEDTRCYKLMEGMTKEHHEKIARQELMHPPVRGKRTPQPEKFNPGLEPLPFTTL